VDYIVEHEGELTPIEVDVVPAARLPEPRVFPREQINGWMAQDEDERKRFEEGK